MTATAIASSASARSGLFRRLAGQELLLAIAIVALAVVVGFINPRFLATRNLSDILLGNAYIAIAAVGMSMVIISGNIDISVGALIGVLATISGSLAVAGAPIIVTWLAPLVVGVAVMAAQGAIIAYLRIPAIVVTLGMLSILKGGLISVTGGKWITDLPQNFHLADLSLFGVPMPVVIMVLATVLAALWMRNSPTGRAIYATGGNPEAARLCGVNPQRTVLMVFALHGFFAGLASLVYATQLRVIQSTTPQGLELTIITAAVVGGVSILGGVGTVVGSTLAAILIAEITSALVFINVSPYWTDALRGALILATVIADILRRQRRAAQGWRAMSLAIETKTFRVPRWLKRHETLLAIILLIALFGLGLMNDRFLTLDNLLNQGRLMTEIGLIALPMTFVIITGGIDISVGAIVGLSAIMLGYSWKTFGFPAATCDRLFALSWARSRASLTALSSRGSKCRRSS